MKRRGATIALAVLLAIFGTAGVLVYVNHANARALAGQKAVTVLVAKSLIPSGTTAADAQQQGLLVPERLPAASVPAGALTAVTPGISALVTDADVQAGQLLLRPMLVTKAQVTNGLAIPRGMIAVAILFCVPEAVADFVQPGSQVAVFDTVITGSSTATVTAQGACTGPHQSNPSVSVTTKLILPKVTVLSVGLASANTQDSQKSASTASSGSSSSGSQNSELVTVAVSQNDAERVIQLTENGLPYLGLANAG